MGTAATAWKLVEAAGHPTTLAAYLIHHPTAHPVWDTWLLSVLTLADTPGYPPANRQYPEAEFELLVMALDPEKPAPDIHSANPKIMPLQPIDICEHFHGVTEEQAKEIATLAIGAIVDGSLSPDQDFGAAWKQTMKNTLDHYRGGLHG